MKVYLLTFPSFKDGAPDEIIGVYDNEDKARKAIAESLFNDEDKRLCDVYPVNMNERI